MSWTKAELSSVCEVFSDGDWIESKDQSENGIRLIQTGNVGLGRFKARDSKARYISEETFKRLRCTEIKQGDILVSRLPDPVGRACLIPKLDEKSITAVDCTIIRTKKEILSTEFLNYFCQSPQYFEQVKTNITGATRQRISRSLLGKTKIPLPPLSTQQKIVTKLDAIFAEIDKATAAAEDNAKNAEALLESILRQSYQFKSGIKTEELGDVCNITGGGTPSKSNSNFFVGDIPWATVRDMNNDYLEETDFKITKEAVKESSTNIIPKNNVVIASRVGLGKVCILKQDTAINQDLRGVVPKNPKALDVNYLFFWFKSISKVIVDAGRGATVHGVTLPFIKSLQIPVPPIAIQEEMVAKLEAISDEVKNSIKSYTDKANELAMLKQSTLRQAFSGKLIKE